MITTQTLTFLADLSLNNHKEWFDQNRKRYETARKNFFEVIGQILQGLETFDEAIAAAALDPKKTVMRINRDIRFSKDKTPYNSHFFTYMSPGGMKGPHAGYYFSVSAGECFYGGGLYAPDSPLLANMRRAIDLHFSEWKSIVEDPALQSTYGEILSNGVLSRPPKDYDKDNPAIEWLKRKGFYTSKTIDPEELLKADFVEKMTQDLRIVHPLVQFINRAVAPHEVDSDN